MVTVTVVDRLRQPEYTGENRCIPCTVVNAVIAAGLALAVGAVAVASGLPALGAAVAGAVVLAVSAAGIYLRGYLVPGTPWFTRTYFPDWLLRRFDKDPAAVDGPGAGSSEAGGDGAGADGGERFDPETFDVEEALARMGVVTECERVDDLCLTDAFRAAWREEVARLREESDDPETFDPDVAGILDTDAAEVSRRDESGAYVATVNGEFVGQWESRGAMLADVAAANVLRGRTELWDALAVPQRGRLLQGLRVFLERCPACGGPVELGEDVVTSCCRSVDVVAVTCRDCGDRLFESEAAAA